MPRTSSFIVVQHVPKVVDQEMELSNFGEPIDILKSIEV